MCVFKKKQMLQNNDNEINFPKNFRPKRIRKDCDLQMDELTLPLDRLVPDAHVESDHDGDGQPEGHDDRHDRHVLVRVDELQKNAFRSEWPDEFVKKSPKM
jgi:hypothetical protein